MGSYGEVFIPGRLCLLGEHSDWIGTHRVHNPVVPNGMCIVCTTNEGLYARYRSTQECVFRFVHEGNELQVPLEVDRLAEEASKGGFFAYICGTACAILEDYDVSNNSTAAATTTLSTSSARAAGIEIDNYKTTLPMKKGLSSSAAVCVLVATCFNEAFGLNMSREEVMEQAYRGEIKTGSQCGRMDQAVAMGKDALGLMLFNGNEMQLQLIRNAAPLHFVVADLKRGKDTCLILASLQECFPIPLDRVQGSMHKYGSLNQRIAWSAVAAIEQGNVTALANALADAQTAFDNCAIENCPSELASPRLHAIMSNSELRKLALAIKGVGSQGDGTVQVLCRGPEEQQAALALLEGELGCEGFLLTVPPSSSPVPRLLHTGRVRCALVITDKTSSSPSSFAMLGPSFPPCLLPVPWSHGTRSMLTTLLQELIACGIQNIAVVVSGGGGNNREMFARIVGEEEVVGVLGGEGDGSSSGERPSLKASSSSSSSNNSGSGSEWSYEKDQFSSLQARVRCFFESPDSWSPYSTLMAAVSSLEAVASGGPLLLARAEGVPLMLESALTKEAIIGHEWHQEVVSCRGGLLSFLRASANKPTSREGEEEKEEVDEGPFVALDANTTDTPSDEKKLALLDSTFAGLVVTPFAAFATFLAHQEEIGGGARDVHGGRDRKNAFLHPLDALLSIFISSYGTGGSVSGRARDELRGERLVTASTMDEADYRKTVLLAASRPLCVI